jgi:gluconokinase
MEEAAALPPDSHGLTILPFLTGERSPLWSDNVTGVVAGLTLHTDKADLLRAGLESVAYRFARLYESVGRSAASRHEIIANGAAILRSPVWQQITTDALGHPIRTLPEDAEASARGAALVALRGIGAIANLADAVDPVLGTPTVEPIPAHTTIYRGAIARQAKLENLLYPNGAVWSD